MLTPEELAELRAFHDAWNDNVGAYNRGLVDARVGLLSQNAHSAIAKLLKREEELRVAATELVDKLVFRVLNTIDRSEVWKDARLNPDSYRQAVRLTLVSFGILEPEVPVTEMSPVALTFPRSTALAESLRAKPTRVPMKPHDQADHSRRTTKHFQNLLGYCVCDYCRELPEVEPFKTGIHAESCPKTRDHSQACECHLKTNYDRPKSEPAHEAKVVRQVIALVREYSQKEVVRGGRIEYVRRDHDDVVADAVHATVAALGYTIRIDGTIAEKP